MRITAKGQVTIPKYVREKTGFVPGADVEFRLDGRGVRLVKAARGMKRRTRGQKLVAKLRGKGKFAMATDEIIALMRGRPADDDTAP